MNSVGVFLCLWQIKPVEVYSEETTVHAVWLMRGRAGEGSQSLSLMSGPGNTIASVNTGKPGARKHLSLSRLTTKHRCKEELKSRQGVMSITLLQQILPVG